MLTPDEIEHRRAFLASLSTPDGPLHPDAAHASVNNPRWFRTIDGVRTPTARRTRLHERILERWRAANPHVVTELSAVLLAGPPGAGKSSTHEQLFHGTDQRQWRELDADVFKRYLLEAAVDDGTLQSLLPPHLRVAPGQTSRFYPFELSALVHHESTGFLFAAAEREAVDRGENLIVDGTLAWKPHAERLVTGLAEAGYRIQVVDVEAPKDVAAERIVDRWRRGFLQAVEAPTDPEYRLGGRWVPVTALDRLFTEFRAPDNAPLHGKSVTEVNAREVSEDHTAVTRYDLYRTRSADAAAEHVERRERLGEGGRLTPVPLPESSSLPTSVSADMPDAREVPAYRRPGRVGRASTENAGSASPDPGQTTSRDLDL